MLAHYLMIRVEKERSRQDLNLQFPFVNGFHLSVSFDNRGRTSEGDSVNKVFYGGLERGIVCSHPTHHDSQTWVMRCVKHCRGGVSKRTQR